MAIEVYFLPPGTGDFKTGLLRKCIAQARNLDYSDILHLAPTNHIVNHFRGSFHEIAGECYIPPRSMTLAQFAKQLHRSQGKKVVIPMAFMPVIISGLAECGMGLATLVAEFIAELKQQFPAGTPEDIRDKVLDAFDANGLPDEAKKRALKAMEMFAAYQEALDENNAVDENDLFSMAADLAAGLQIRTLMLDGFYELTPAEEQFIVSLIKRASHTIASIPISSETDDLSYCYIYNINKYFKFNAAFIPGEPPSREMVFHPAPSMEEELEDIAKHIKSSYITGKQRDLDSTFLVFPRLAPYRNMVERVFDRFGVPCVFSTGKSLAMTRPCLDLLSLLESVTEDYPRLPFSTFLTSPFFLKVPPELKAAVPRISLSSGIIKGREAWLSEFGKAGVYRQARSLFKSIDASMLAGFTGTYGDKAKVIIDISERFGFRPPDEVKVEFEEALKKISLLDRFVKKSPGLPGFIDALRRVLDSTQVPCKGHGVRVASLNEVRGLEARMLCMAGLKDGDIPLRPEMDFLLPDSVRRRLGLLDIKRHMHLEEHIFRRLTLAARELYLSYPEMEGMKFYLPSMFLSEAREDRQRLTGIFSPEDMLRHQKKPALQIKEINEIRKFKEDSALRVTDIDAYRACPRKFFIERLLKLAPPEVLDYEIEPMALGSVVHEVMEHLLPRVPASLDAFVERASETLDEVLKEKPFDAYFKMLIRETFIELAPELFEIEEKLHDEGYAFGQAEYEVRGEPLKGIPLKGKVDRIDRGPGGAVEVIDYKTGAVSVSSSTALQKGANLQLFLYAAMLKSLGMHPERVGIYSLKDVHLKWFPTKIDRKKGFSLDDFIESSLRFLETTVRDMRNGDFRAMPIEEQTCRNCPERPYCPYIQGRGADSE